MAEDGYKSRQNAARYVDSARRPVDSRELKASGAAGTWQRRRSSHMAVGLLVQQLRFATRTLALVIARNLHSAGIVPQHQRDVGCCNDHHQDEAIGHQQASLDR